MGVDSLVSQRVGLSLVLDAEVALVEGVVLRGRELFEFVGRLAPSAESLQPNGGEGVEFFVEVDPAGAELLQTEAVDFVVAVSFIGLSGWQLYYHRGSSGVAVRVDDLEVEVSRVV